MNGNGDVSGGGSRKRAGRGHARWLVRGAFLLAAVVALSAGPRWPKSAALVPAASPLVALASVAATWSVPALVWTGLLVGLAALVRRRWFCRWACPVGLCADAASKAGRLLGRRCPRLAPLGQWIALVTLGGALVGYPLLLWLDPMALLAGAFGPLGPQSDWVPWWAAAGLPALLLASVVFPLAWCHRVCPLGAVQDVLWRCASALRQARSAGCSRSHSAGGVRLARRVVVFGLVGIGWALAAKRVRGVVARRLRPPGALGPEKFPGVCIRCGNCIRVCPTGVIAPDLGEGGIAGFLAPTLRFERDYCLENCTRCTEACPSGALRRLAVEDKPAAAIGFPRVDMDLCLLSDDAECSACRNHCPYEAITYPFSEATYTLRPEIDPRRCPGCGACEAACPTSPVKAIIVEPL